VCPNCGLHLYHDPDWDRSECKKCGFIYRYPEIDGKVYVGEENVNAFQEIVHQIMDLAEKQPMVQFLDISPEITNYIKENMQDINLLQSSQIYRSDVIEKQPMIQLGDFSPQIIDRLIKNPQEINMLSHEQFEMLIADMLHSMGMGVRRTGAINKKDGGIDIVAWPLSDCLFPFLVAVQVKHHYNTHISTGVKEVRDFIGSLSLVRFDAGLLVTNTEFTPDAHWAAEQWNRILRLRDFSDLKRWLRGDFANEAEWKDFPKEIEICPGVIIALPKPSARRR
jgi:restriction endonuclease Mrr